MKKLMLVATLFAGAAGLGTSAASAATVCGGCYRAHTHAVHAAELQTGRSVVGDGKQAQVAMLPLHPPLPPRRPVEFR